MPNTTPKPAARRHAPDTRTELEKALDRADQAETRATRAIAELNKHKMTAYYGVSKEDLDLIDDNASPAAMERLARRLGTQTPTSKSARIATEGDDENDAG